MIMGTRIKEGSADKNRRRNGCAKKFAGSIAILGFIISLFI
jgi:hypothetical protein